ncbi:hypothetical protein DPV78_003629 [Talaromyces pinophilus]|nr:hypothetical protein DPV78_003629 [Talaromyces pinophilus]
MHTLRFGIPSLGILRYAIAVSQLQYQHELFCRRELVKELVYSITESESHDDDDDADDKC